MLIAILAAFLLLKISLDHFNRRRGHIHTPERSVIKSENSVNPQLQIYGATKTKIMTNFQQQLQSALVVEEDDSVDYTNTIIFKPGDRHFCHEISGKHVKVVCNPGTHDHGSSSVKLKNIVDYKWEIKNYPGHLIAVHVDGKHIAYAINVNNKVSRMEGMVRVLNAQSGLRALIKGMSGEVLDLQFAYIENERILATIDMNSLYVHRIDMLDETLLCNLILKIEDPLTNYTPKYDKISWCPFIETPDEDFDYNKLIVWSRGSMFQCFDVNEIVVEHGIGKIQPDACTTGYLKLYDESITNTWVALSPDGSTLSVGSTDGYIRFYQMYMHDKEPRCLHQWKPHNGKAVSSFFFLDNLNKKVADAYWKFAITGALNNTEIKVWDCSNWTCLQTLTVATPLDEKKTPHFIAEIDRSASYIVLSNVDTRAVYILQIINNNTISVKDPDGEQLKDTSTNSGSSSGGKTKVQRSLQGPLVYIKSICEFPLSSGILSFSIVDAALRRYKCTNDNYLCEEMDDYEDDANSVFCVVVRLFIVQSKSMQECHILYQPTLNETAELRSALAAESNSNKNSSIEGDKHTSIGNGEGEKDDDEDDDDADADADADDDEDEDDDDDDVNSIKQDIAKTDNNTLEVLLGLAGNASALEKTDSPAASPQMAVSSGGKLNLMTPDAFKSTVNDKKTPESGVSSEVLNTILMLASVAGQKAPPVPKPESMKRLNLINNKMVEDQELQKLQKKPPLESQKNFIAIDNNPGRNANENLTSGGSSPSREVQEIMSLQEYDKNSYSGDELLDERPLPTETATNQLDVNISENISGSKSQPTAPTNWPKAPEVHKVTKHSADLQNAANLISQAVNASSMGSLNSGHMAPPTLINSCNTSNMNLASANNCAEISEINMKMNQLIDLVKIQSMQINSLQNEVAEMKNSNPSISSKSMSEYSFKLEMQLSKLMEQYLKRCENEHKKKLNAFVAARDAQLRELRDHFIQISNQYILTQFGEAVAKVISVEFQRQLTPLLATRLDLMQQQMQIEIGQKMSGFDVMLKENIAQVCKSKNIIEAFGKSVLVGVQGSLQSAFIESMSSTLIPAYEKSSQNMFKQLHDAFSDGIKDVMDQFDNYLQQFQPAQEATAELLNKLHSFRQVFDSSFQKHRNTMAETLLETRKDIKGLEVLLTHQIQECIRSEVRKSFESQAVALRSQANTPAPTYDMREAIKILLHQGHINKAFHQALIANDLNLVEFTLKSADHNAVFTPVCCLEQKVLLSLIQQISADMSNHNEVKQNYLAEALLAINPLDPITREHAPKVLQDLFRNCQIFLMNYPKSPQCSNVRMLMKGVQAYKDQF